MVMIEYVIFPHGGSPHEFLSGPVAFHHYRSRNVGSTLAAFTQSGQVLNVKGTPLILFGDLTRPAGRGPGTTNLDSSLFRSFLHERMHIQFRAEAFNRDQYTGILPTPALTIGNANFGKLTASSATGRQLQFGLKLLFLRGRRSNAARKGG